MSTHRALTIALPLVLLLGLAAMAAGQDLPPTAPPAPGRPVAPPSGEVRVPDFAVAPDLHDLRRIIVQEGGRKKPFDTYARERLSNATGRSSVDGADACLVLLGMTLEPQRWLDRPLVRVTNPDVVRMLGRESSGYVSFTDLLSNQGFREAVMEAIACQRASQGSTNVDRPQLTATQRVVLDLYQERHYFESIAADLRILPPPAGAEERIERLLIGAGLDYIPEDPTKRFTAPWLAIGQAPQQDDFPDEVRMLFEGADGAALWRSVLAQYDYGDRMPGITAAWNELAAGYLAADGATLEQASRALLAELAAVNPDGYPRGVPVEVEILYHAAHPFRVAYGLFLVAFILALAFWITGSTAAYRLSILGVAAGFLFHTAGLVARGYLGGRAPWANLFEATITITWGGVLFALAFERAYRTGLFAGAAALAGFLGLAAADLMPVSFGSHVEPLVPVLRSYWLVIHVSSLLLSYGAFAIAAMVGVVSLIMRVREGPKPEILERYDRYIYRVVQVGFVFLTAGIILGAVWANESWGRYWGWDPKETWAFITWCGYAAFLHGRMVGWFKGASTAVASVVGFLLVLFTYIGVSFLLPGLHSYMS